MSDLSIPFNIELLNLTKDKLVGITPVTSLDMFEGMSRNLHDDGLFSTTIFGRIGSPARSTRFSYIDIKVPIFHPTIFRALVQLKSLYGEILQGKSYATWSPEINDFVKSNQMDGETGYSFFERHWANIEFEERPSDVRQVNIKLIEKYKHIALTDKVIVIPASLRDIEIEEDGRVSVNEINGFYKKLISISNAINASTIKDNLELLDGARYSLQFTFNQIYDLIEAMIKGKKKLMMGKWASRKIFNGTRNVITSTDIRSNRLNAEENISFNHTVCGLFQFMKASLPLSIYKLRNDFLSKVFVSSQGPSFLTNKKTWKKEAVNVSSDIFDTWMSDEGLEKVISLFGEESLRHKELEIEGHYIGLIYKGPSVFKMFQDIDELPDGFNKEDVYPITFTELMYCSVYNDSDKYPALVTRYPVTGFGSIYVSKVYLKPTLETEIRTPLGEDWQPDPFKKIAYNFPTKSDFVNSMSPHPAYLARLGADFDGDTASLNILYSDEAMAEAEKYMQSARYYVGTDGRISFSSETDTVRFVVHNLTTDL
jgi:hypothetical protein